MEGKSAMDPSVNDDEEEPQPHSMAANGSLDSDHRACIACAEDGQRPCSWCHTTGWTDCGLCSGKGECKHPGNSRQYGTCPQCKGGGKARCATCQGRGTRPCGECGGAGQQAPRTEATMTTESGTINQNLESDSTGLTATASSKPTAWSSAEDHEELKPQSDAKLQDGMVDLAQSHDSPKPILTAQAPLNTPGQTPPTQEPSNPGSPAQIPLAQMPPNPVPPVQISLAEAPPNPVSPAQMSLAQAPPNPMSPAQMSLAQAPRNPVPPVQIPLAEAPPNPMSPAQIPLAQAPPNPMSPAQMSLVQAPPNPVPLAHAPPNPMSPAQMPLAQAPPNPEPPTIDTSGNETRPQIRLPLINEEQAKDALSKFVSEHTCYGSDVIKKMSVRDITTNSAFHYKLESFCEARSVGASQRPYSGGMIDSNTGTPPNPWNMVVPRPIPFSNSSRVLPIPHTTTLEVCNTCGVARRPKCGQCQSGKVTCTQCSGAGHCVNPRNSLQYGTCTLCNGNRTTTCHDCHGTGTRLCGKCDGEGKYVRFQELRVTWINHVSDSVTNLSEDLPPELIQGLTQAGGQEVFLQSQDRVTPLRGFPDPALIRNSNQLLLQHSKEYVNERTLSQRQTVRVVPVTRVMYEYKGNEYKFFVYGIENLVYHPDSSMNQNSESDSVGFTAISSSEPAAWCSAEDHEELKSDAKLQDGMVDLAQSHASPKPMSTVQAPLNTPGQTPPTHAPSNQGSPAQMSLVQAPPNPISPAQMPLAQAPPNPMSPAQMSLGQAPPNPMSPVQMPLAQAPPNPEPPTMDTSGNETRPQIRLPLINEEQAKDALSNFVSEHTCYGSDVIKKMSVRDLKSNSAFHYKLESFCEARSVGVGQRPYSGGMVDSNTGTPPNPWNMAVPRPIPFSNSSRVLPIPHTTTLEVCSACGGACRLKCGQCQNGRVTCPRCSGRGHCVNPGNSRQYGTCTSCNGNRTTTCHGCSGMGTRLCGNCSGAGKFARFQELRVTWRNHASDSVTNLSEDLPPEVIQGLTQAGGQEVFRESQDRVTPLRGFPDPALIRNSNHLLEQHSKDYVNERTLSQRQTVRVVPVTRVMYEYKGSEYEFFVYGFENRVYHPDYPQQCLCFGRCSLM